MERWKTAKAVSLRETAIERMRENDFGGGRKSAVEAQKLCHTLEDMHRMIVVCNVHCAAANGKDWYKILDVAAAADESAVRSQCNRMALALHPDKNKFPGAAEAFQLFLEARNVLLNNEKRRVYDSMCRARAMGENSSSGFSGFRNDHLQSGVGPNFGFARFRDGFKPQQEIDQTIGNLDSVFSSIVNDQQCQQLFYQLNAENHLGLGRSGRGIGRPRGRGSKTNEASKINENMVVLDQPANKDLPNVSRGRGRPRGRGRGLKMNEVEELKMSNCSKENVVDLDQPSSTDQPNISRGRGRPRGRGRGRGSKVNEASKIEELMSVSSSSSKEYLQNLDQNAQPSKGGSIDGEETAHKAKKLKSSGSCSATAEEADRRGKFRVEFKPSPAIEPDSKILEYTDAEFHDFEKDRCITRFGEGQLWAAYDTLDAMPRFYALINSISDDHTIHITWLEPLPNNDDEKQWLYQGLPASTGRFVHGHTDTLQDHSFFSHLVNCKRDPVLKKVHEIHPKKGETWAVFKNWDIRRFGGYEYEVVEILSDYHSDFGVSVAWLEKIEGFYCVYGRKVGKGVGWEVIKGKDRLRFAHRIPSLSVTINNPNDLNNLFELDPASLPPSLRGR